MLRLALLGTLLVVASLSVTAQTPAERPNVSQVFKKFTEERAEAAKVLPPDELTRADTIFNKAETARTAGNTELAERYATQARWALPFLPANLPEHVSRVYCLARLRHGARINALAYFPDGSKLASASHDGTVKIWDIGNGRELLTYRGHLTAPATPNNADAIRVPGIAVSRDGSKIASTGPLEIHVWDAKSGKLLHTLNGHSKSPHALAFLDDGKFLVSVGEDRRPILWDIATGKPKTTYQEQPKSIEAVTISPDGKAFATLNTNGEASIYKLDESKPIFTNLVVGGTQQGFGLQFHPENAALFVSGGGTVANLIAVPTAGNSVGNPGMNVKAFDARKLKINALGCTPDGKLLLTGGNDKNIRFWNVQTGQVVWTIQNAHMDDISSLVIAPDGKSFASGAIDGTIRIWPITEKEEYRLHDDAKEAIWSVAISSDGKRYAAGGADRIVRVYETQSGKLLKSLKGHKGAIPSVAFIGSDFVASASGSMSADRAVKVWDLSTEKVVECAGHTSAILCLASDGTTLFSGSVDKTFRAWDPKSGKELWSYAAPSAVASLAVDKTGKSFLLGHADGTISLLGLQGKEIKVIARDEAHIAGVAAVAFHPSGTLFLTAGGNGAIRLWNITEGRIIPSKKIPIYSRTGKDTTAAIAAAVFSPDGSHFAFGGADGIVHIYNTRTQNSVQEFHGHNDWLTSLVFHPEGDVLLSSGVDKTVRCFDVPHDRGDSRAGAMMCRAAAISPDGKLLVGAIQTEDTVRLLNLVDGRELGNGVGGYACDVIAFKDSKEIVAAADDKLRYLTVPTLAEGPSTTAGGRVYQMAATREGNVAVVWTKPVGNDETTTFEVYDAKGTLIADVSDKGRSIRCSCIASDIQYGVSGGEDGVLRVWNLKTKERVGDDWQITTKKLYDLILTPDNKTLITVDGDGEVKIANFEKRETTTTIQAFDESPTGKGIALSADGSRFAMATTSGLVKVFDLKGKVLRSWKLPTSSSVLVFESSGKKMISCNTDGTIYVLDLP